jgi:HlyD family secretion protein
MLVRACTWNYAVSDPLSSDLASLKIDRSAPMQAAPRERRSMAWLMWLGILAALAGGVYAAWPYMEARVFKTKVSLTEVVRVSPSQGQTVLTSTGYVVPQVVSHIGATTTGRVLRVAVREGQAVHVDDLLVELDALDADRAIAAAQAKVLAATARAATARAELAEITVQATRQRRLVELGAAPGATLEDLEARIGSLEAAASAANAEARAARSEVEVARAAANRLRIVSPINGTVITEPPDPGDVVHPERELLQIADLSTLLVETDVPESRLGTVRIGAPCEVVLDAFPGRRFRGETAEIGRRIDRARATVEVRVRLTDATEDVLPEMAARVSFLTSALTEAQMQASTRIVVPSDAVVTRNGQKVVFALEDGVARMHRVRLGERTQDGFVLEEGPDPGTRLVARPAATMADGQRIEERTD